MTVLNNENRCLMLIALKRLSTVVSIQATVDFLNSLLNFFVILQFQLMKTNCATDCVVTLDYNDSSENI